MSDTVGSLVVIKKNGAEGSYFPIDKDRAYNIGSNSDCHIRFNIEQFQENVCTFAVNNKGNVTLTKNSRCPIFLNNVEIKSNKPVKFDDVIEIGAKTFKWIRKTNPRESFTRKVFSAKKTQKAKRRSSLTALNTLQENEENLKNENIAKTLPKNHGSQSKTPRSAAAAKSLKFGQSERKTSPNKRKYFEANAKPSKIPRKFFPEPSTPTQKEKRQSLRKSVKDLNLSITPIPIALKETNSNVRTPDSLGFKPLTPNIKLVKSVSKKNASLKKSLDNKILSKKRKMSNVGDDEFFQNKKFKLAESSLLQDETMGSMFDSSISLLESPGLGTSRRSNRTISSPIRTSPPSQFSPEQFYEHTEEIVNKSRRRRNTESNLVSLKTPNEKSKPAFSTPNVLVVRPRKTPKKVSAAKTSLSGVKKLLGTPAVKTPRVSSARKSLKISPSKTSKVLSSKVLKTPVSVSRPKTPVSGVKKLSRTPGSPYTLVFSPDNSPRKSWTIIGSPYKIENVSLISDTCVSPRKSLGTPGTSSKSLATPGSARKSLGTSGSVSPRKSFNTTEIYKIENVSLISDTSFSVSPRKSLATPENLGTPGSVARLSNPRKSFNTTGSPLKTPEIKNILKTPGCSRSFKKSLGSPGNAVKIPSARKSLYTTASPLKTPEIKNNLNTPGSKTSLRKGFGTPGSAVKHSSVRKSLNTADSPLKSPKKSLYTTGSPLKTPKSARKSLGAPGSAVKISSTRKNLNITESPRKSLNTSGSPLKSPRKSLNTPRKMKNILKTPVSSSRSRKSLGTPGRASARKSLHNPESISKTPKIKNNLITPGSSKSLRNSLEAPGSAVKVSARKSLNTTGSPLKTSKSPRKSLGTPGSAVKISWASINLNTTASPLKSPSKTSKIINLLITPGSRSSIRKSLGTPPRKSGVASPRMSSAMKRVTTPGSSRKSLKIKKSPGVSAKKLSKSPKVLSSKILRISGKKSVSRPSKSPKIASVTKVLKYIIKSPKSPSTDVKVGRSKKVLRTAGRPQKSPKNDLTNVAGVKKLLKTPGRTPKSPKNDLTNVAGVKKLLKTPCGRPPKSPKNDLTNVAGVKKLLKTPGGRPPKSPKNDLTNVTGVKKLLGSPGRKRKSPKNDLRNVAGVKKLLGSPGVVRPQNIPKNELDDLRGVRNLLRTPDLNQQKSPKNDLLDVSLIKTLFNSPPNRSMDNIFDGLKDADDSLNLTVMVNSKSPLRTYERKGKSLSPDKRPANPQNRKSLRSVSDSRAKTTVEEWLSKYHLMRKIAEDVPLGPKRALTPRPRRGRKPAEDAPPGAKRALKDDDKAQTNAKKVTSRNRKPSEDAAPDSKQGSEDATPQTVSGRTRRGRKPAEEVQKTPLEDTPTPRLRRGRKPAEEDLHVHFEEKPAKKSPGKSRKRKLEEEVVSSPVRSSRRKKLQEKPQVDFEDVLPRGKRAKPATSSKKTEEIKPSRGRLAQKEDLKEETPKAEKTARPKRGKKTAEIVETPEEIIQVPVKATRGRKPKEVIEGTPVVEKKLTPLRATRGKPKKKVDETPEIVEKPKRNARAKKVEETTPVTKQKSTRGKKQTKTVDETVEVRETKTRSTRAKKTEEPAPQRSTRARRNN